HAVEAHQAIRSPMLERREDHLGVALAPEANAASFEQAPQLEEIVDLAVVGHDVAAARRRHGLTARFREVEDGETSMTKSHSIVILEDDRLAIGAAVRQCTDEPL